MKTDTKDQLSANQSNFRTVFLRGVGPVSIRSNSPCPGCNRTLPDDPMCIVEIDVDDDAEIYREGRMVANFKREIGVRIQDRCCQWAEDNGVNLHFHYRKVAL